jgi:uncharacterized protein YndB with AHSA1/START domain
LISTTITAPAGSPFIDISREFDAPRDLLYRAHTDPELLPQWLGPSRLPLVVDEYDVRHGGRWRYFQRDDDGAEYGFHGVFHGTPSPDGIVQTFEFEGAPGHVSLNRLTLEAHGGRTVVHVHSTFESVQARDAMVAAGMEHGLDEGYRRLDALLARLTPAVVS